jgi:hypothetical protein
MLGKVLLQIHNIHHYQVKLNNLYHRIRLFELRIRSVFMESEFPFDAGKDFKYFYPKQIFCNNLFYLKQYAWHTAFRFKFKHFHSDNWIYFKQFCGPRQCCGSGSQSKEVTRGPPELVQHFRL